jgi:hypothetical protein
MTADRQQHINSKSALFQLRSCSNLRSYRPFRFDFTRELVSRTYLDMVGFTGSIPVMLTTNSLFFSISRIILAPIAGRLRNRTRRAVPRDPRLVVLGQKQ